MNIETAWSPPPTLANYIATADAKDEGKIGWVYTAFAYGLFVAAEKHRANATVAQITLSAARSTVKLWKRKAEAGWVAKGYPVMWADDDYDAIAKEMADTLPRHPLVVAVVERNLETWRDEVFNNTQLTRNSELFVVEYKAINEVQSVMIKEAPIETINRSLDHLDLLKELKNGLEFLKLRRILTCLARVHAIAVDD
jgi:hypothetical protein